MTLTVFFSAPAVWGEYRDLLPLLLENAGIDAQVVTEAPDPVAVDYIIYAPSATLQNFTPFTRCKAVLSLWAGVERIVGNATLTQPLCRMVD
ncbi:MAG: glyoxylate/hydroxypyruvate reductase A, partial [Cypionkella sp.]|nr:glyoxylate/hydroxypyruvate reductase A [Cypionkella sp.]